MSVVESLKTEFSNHLAGLRTMADKIKSLDETVHARMHEGISSIEAGFERRCVALASDEQAVREFVSDHIVKIHNAMSKLLADLHVGDAPVEDNSNKSVDGDNLAQ